MTLQQFLQTIINSFQGMAMYSLATFGIVLIFRTSTTTNFAQGVIATFGCYMATQLCIVKGMSLFVGVPVGMAVAFLIGAFIDIAIIRQARNINASGKQMITMGVLMVLTSIIPVLFSMITVTTPATKNYSTEIWYFKLFNQSLYWPMQSIICCILAITLLGIIFAALKFTKWGLGVRATASNEQVAKMMGINTRVVTALSWALAGALATVSAVSLQTVLNPAMMGKAQVYGFLACVLGGVSSFFAPVIGAILIPLIINFAAAITPSWAELTMFCLILLIILIRPNGLFGKKMIKKV